MKKTPPKTDFITHTFLLTQEEMAAKASQLGRLSVERARLEAELSDASSRWKAQIKLKTAEIKQAAEVAHAGEEDRRVECELEYDHVQHVVRYRYQGIVLKDRPMEHHERQLEMSLVQHSEADDNNREPATEEAQA